MKKIKFFLSLILSLATIVAAAQSVTVKGSIRDAKSGEGVPAASVIVKGTTTGVVADANGNYSITAPSKGTLVISSIGYETQEVEINGASIKNITLAQDAKMLDETIVVAYGTQKKSSFVGAATQLNEKDLEKMQSTNISKALEGSVAGVQVASSSGSPGASASIQIRGIGSINASTSPLIVVDGTPYEGSLNSIPAQDIESLTVLKDAAANSMYGARGSNGVILISTKRGKAGKVHVNFDAKWGANTMGVPFYDTINNPGDYYEMMWEASRNNAYYNGALDLAQAGIYASNALVGEHHLYNIYKGIENDKIIDPATGKLNPNAKELKWHDNWKDMIFRPGFRQEYSISASGGSENTQGYFSLSYLDDGGYVTNSGFKRLSARAKVDHQFLSWLKAGLNVAYSNTNRSIYNDNESNNYSNLFMTVQDTPCIYPVYLYDQTTGALQRDKDGKPLFDWGENGRPYGSNSNAYGQLVSSQYSTIIDNVSTRGYVKVNILKDLAVTANVAYDVFNSKNNAYMTPEGGDAKTFGGRGEQTMSRYGALNANQLINYTPSVGKSNFNILLGHEIKKDSGYSLYGHMTNFVDPIVPDFTNATKYEDLQSASDAYFLEGFFARGEWDYDNRYYLSASYRLDGSSRFSANKRWGNFWSVGGAWNIANEKFMSGVNWIDALKLKASYGTQGNDNIGYTFVYENLYGISRVNNAASLTKAFRAAKDLTWEKSANFNVGIEARLFDRLSLNVDYFIKETKDMIYARPLALSMGSPASQLVNDMDMMNSGVEFDLNVNVFRNKNISWDINLNGTHYKNKLTRLPSDYPSYGKAVGTTWREIGQPLYNFYLKEYAGVDPETGSPLYNIYEKDAETGLAIGKPIGTTNVAESATDIRTFKTSIPDLYGGFGTDFKAYGFDLSASFAYQIGGYTYDSVYQSLMSAGNVQNTWHKDIFRRWTPENTNTDVPRVQLGAQQTNATSTRFLITSSYISLRNLTFGYTLPKKWTDAIKIQGVRVYFQGENLFYLSARKGMDVRKSFSGATGNTYSALRTISGGVSISF